MDIHGYPQKICGYGYGYGCEISYPRQPCNFQACGFVLVPPPQKKIIIGLLVTVKRSDHNFITQQQSVT